MNEYEWDVLYESQQVRGQGTNDLYLKPDGSGALLCEDDYYTQDITREQMQAIYERLKKVFEVKPLLEEEDLSRADWKKLLPDHVELVGPGVSRKGTHSAVMLVGQKRGGSFARLEVKAPSMMKDRKLIDKVLIRTFVEKVQELWIA